MLQMAMLRIYGNYGERPAIILTSLLPLLVIGLVVAHKVHNPVNNTILLL
jgi:hypothetical protein